MTATPFRTLGRSGLVVSPFALGTMTFGAQRWGSGEATSRAVFDAYVEAGGNFLDTADVYSAGRSEEMVGEFIHDHQARHRLVLATKAGFAREAGYPHAGGNGAKNITAALEGSLRRLRTDCVDLFWLHVWDMVTPAEEVLQTLTTLVRAGKIRHYGISNAPAWYIAKLATLAAVHGLPAPIALQFEYSLVERGIENEHVDAAREFGLGILGWSPLGGGLLTGKYRRADVEGRTSTERGLPSAAAKPGEEAGDGAGRLGGANPFGDSKFTAHNWEVLDVLTAVAGELNRTPAAVALAWSLARPGIAGLVIGASRVEQLRDNLSALEITLAPEQRQRLDAVSATPLTYPANIAVPAINRMVFGGQTVTRWRG
jgi:aryl-alcohol dehydrogenase-like predicted oxidoreductase